MTFLVGRPSPSIPVQPRAFPISPRHLPPSPPACSPDDVSSWARAKDGRGVPPPPEMIIHSMNHMCHHNQKRPLPMLVSLKIWIWKRLMWNLVRKHTSAPSRNRRGILIKSLALYVPMKRKKTFRLHSFGQRYNMMHSMVI
jgi:hypothetical protein